MGNAALPALKQAAKNHPNAAVRKKAKYMLAALTQWPCRTNLDVKQAPRILHGCKKDFHQAQAKLSWNGTQLHPVPTITFVTKGYMDATFLFPQRLNDSTMWEPFTVTPQEFQHMMAGVKKLVGKPGEDVILDVIR